MCETIDREIVAAYLRGEHDLIEELKEISLTLPPKTNTLTVGKLNANQVHGYNNFVRRLRDAA